MKCDEVDERGIAEDYLLGRLSEADRETFEQHYFECAECYARLEALRAVKDALISGPASNRRGQRTVWPWLALAAAVLVVIAGAALAWRAGLEDGRQHAPAVVTSAPTSAPARIPEDVLQLARVDPPPYEPRRLRSGVERRGFDAAMARYQARDFSGAIPLLEAVVQSSDADDASRFYLGASYAAASRWHDAIATLRPLMSNRGSPYAEEAAFIAARAHVHLEDVTAAIAALDVTIGFAGDRQAEAKALRARLAALR